MIRPKDKSDRHAGAKYTAANRTFQDVELLRSILSEMNNVYEFHAYISQFKNSHTSLFPKS